MKKPAKQRWENKFMNKTKECFYKHNGQIIRFFIILFLAIFVNIFLIPDRQFFADNLPLIEKGNSSYIDSDYLNALKLNITQQIQDSINSGNLAEVFWKIVYLGNGVDNLCYQINDSNIAIILNDTVTGHDYLLINKESKCFDATKPRPALSYIITISPYNSQEQMCIPGKSFWENSTYYTEVSKEHYEIPSIPTYFEANNFHKSIKFILIFILTGIVCWNVTRVYIFIRDGFRK
jgi:hypothetical protein